MHSWFLNGLLIFTLVVVIAYFGGSLLLPVLFAFLFWVVIHSWSQWIERLSIGGMRIPRKLQGLVSVLLLIVVVTALGSLLSGELQEFTKIYPVLEQNLQNRISQLENLTGLTIFDSLSQFVSQIDLVSILRALAEAVTSLSTVLFTVIVYVMYIFGEEKYFQAKLKNAAGEDYSAQQALFTDIIQTIEKYMSVKTATSLLTAVLSFLVMTAIGVQFAFVWAALIFVMNFIPNIGSIIATGFPVVFALVSMPSVWSAVLILVLVGAIQMMVGYFVEPKYMGKQLNLSPLLVFFSLFFWGAIWGIPGMFISVPVTVIIMIVLARIPATRSIGVWMSQDGIV